MADISQIEAALVKADAAGDTEGARILAGEVRRLRSAQNVEPAKEPEKMPETMQIVRDLTAGALRGAGSIGSTLLAPYDIAKDALAGKGLSLDSNRQRRAAIDEGLQTLGADRDSMSYQGGKLGSEIAGTAGIGGLMGNALRGVPMLSKLAPVVESGGFNLGQSATGNAAANALFRAGGGAVQGGAAAGLVDPSQMGTGAAIGAAAPGVIKAAGMAGNAVSGMADTVSKKLMQSALKPTIEQLRKGQAQRAIQTLLDEGINPTTGGMDKLRGRVSGLNDEIATMIANSDKTVSKAKVLDALNSTKQKFTTQVDPMPDLNAIESVAERFAVHPSLPDDAIPVQLAQQLKQGTYKTLSKKYGQVGSAETEAQKALARGLKEGVSEAVPGVSALNARESELINALKVAERRAMMDQNKNPLGLAPIAPSAAGIATFLADRSALLKALAARGVNQTGKAAAMTPQLEQILKQYGLLGAPSVLATSP